MLEIRDYSPAPAPIRAPAEASTVSPSSTNARVAEALERTATLLELGGAGVHRVRAYRSAAETVRAQTRPIAEIAAAGSRALAALPGIGDRLAGVIEEIVRRGTFGLLERLEGETAPEDLLASVPGLGGTLAQRVHDTLGITSLEDLEVAAHDGRLATVRGFGPRRLRLVRQTLDSMLRRTGTRHGRNDDRDRSAPDATMLLEVDAEYRRRAAAGRLRTIAPRRHNPDRQAWLPIWHTERDGWELDVMFSNTARAHALRRTDDWVVVYFGRDGGRERQVTVVTDRWGNRVVRGLPAAAVQATG